MFSAFSTALSALTANSNAIDVVGNNLANLNTTGYKSVQVQFSDLISQSLGVGSNSAQAGLGVGPILTQAQYTQGGISNTRGPTDVAIQGGGFFVLKDQNNQTLYTRDGSFRVDTSGNLTSASGQLVQGWSAVNGVVNPNGAVGNLTIPTGSVVPATPTGNMSVAINLNAQASGATATFAAPVQVYDAQGATHTLTITFTQTAANSWNYSVDIPAADLKSGGTTALATGTLTFDGTGKLTSPAAAASAIPVKVTGLADGASDMNLNWNVYDASGNPTLTQFAQVSSVGNVTQDGSAAGQVTSVGLQSGGLLVASYSNGQQLTVGQLALASIANPDSLVSMGNNNLKATMATAPAVVGAANTAARGQIMGGALESSNADMATQFTDLLSYERSYQAASRVITTDDQLLQETVSLIHP